MKDYSLDGNRARRESKGEGGTMTDRQIRSKLDQLAIIANSLVEEAHRRYGSGGNVFYEAGGTFHMMEGDVGGSSKERQRLVRFSSSEYCLLGSGVW